MLYDLIKWSILSGSGNGSSWHMLQFQVLIDSSDLTWNHVAKCSHLATNVMTDGHTDRQTNFPPQVKNIIPFFKGIIRRKTRGEDEVRVMEIIYPSWAVSVLITLEYVAIFAVFDITISIFDKMSVSDYTWLIDVTDSLKLRNWNIHIIEWNP